MTEVDKELFSLTKDFGIDDWSAIRTEEHWSTRDMIKGTYAKNEFLLKEVKKYLGV